MLSSPQLSRRSHLLKLLVIVFVLAIAAFSTIPNYFTGKWTWEQTLKVPNLSELRAIQKQGLALPGWQTLDQKETEIGGHRWSVQTLLPAEANPSDAGQSSVILMLRPQSWQRDQPQVDWMDINGLQRWTADSLRQLPFTATISAITGTQAQAATVNARFLRGWNQQYTYAVLQWYAWSDGGDAAPSQWFWADQLSQWRDRHRMPWVAVSILIPMKPVGDLDTMRSIAESLGQTVQATLMSGALRAE